MSFKFENSLKSMTFQFVLGRNSQSADVGKFAEIILLIETLFVFWKTYSFNGVKS